MEEFKQVDIVTLGSEVFLQQEVDGAFEHESIVDGDVADTGDTVPTRLTTSSDRLVHHVVGDEEVGLELR